MTSISEHVRAIRIPLTIFFFLTLVLIGFTLWSHVRLPDNMAVHFNGRGVPDRWSSKWEMTIVMLAVALNFALLFGLFSILVPKIPAKLWNIPHKDHWMAPERVAGTLAEFSRDYLIMGILMVGLMLYVAWDVYQANVVREEPVLSAGIWGVFGVVALVLGIVLRMILRYYRVPDET